MQWVAVRTCCREIKQPTQKCSLRSISKATRYVISPCFTFSPPIILPPKGGELNSKNYKRS